MVLLRWITPALALLLISCDDKNDFAQRSPPPATNPPHLYLDHAQPRLPTIKLWLGAQEMDAEMALTQTQIYTGMMYRKEMGTNDGMLFVFPRPDRKAFYMRNTVIPLSAAYIDPEGTILEVHDLKPLEETPVEAGSDNIQFVLETPQGWFKKNNIGVGTLVRTERGSLRETFFRKQP